MLEDYYQTKFVNKSRKEYICDCCGDIIPKNTASDVHTFYSYDFNNLRTHKECTVKFLNGCFCFYCGEWIENDDEISYQNKIVCEKCYMDEINYSNNNNLNL